MRKVRLFFHTCHVVEEVYVYQAAMFYFTVSQPPEGSQLSLRGFLQAHVCTSMFTKGSRCCEPINISKY